MANPILLDLNTLAVESFDVVSPGPSPEPAPLPLTPTWEKDCTKDTVCGI